MVGAMLKYPAVYLRVVRWALPLALCAASACEVPDSAGPTPVPEQNLLFDSNAGDSDLDAGK